MIINPISEKVHLSTELDEDMEHGRLVVVEVPRVGVALKEDVELFE